MRVGVMQRISECDALFFRLEQNPTAVRIPGTACSYKHESSKHWHMRKLPFRAGAERTEPALPLQGDARRAASVPGRVCAFTLVPIKDFYRTAGQRYARVLRQQCGPNTSISPVPPAAAGRAALGRQERKTAGRA